MKRIKSILSTKKHLALVAAALVVVACAGFYFWGDSASAAPYMTSRVERGNLRNTVTATGTLQAVTTVQVGSQVSGTISELDADFNSVVKKGQVSPGAEVRVARLTAVVIGAISIGLGILALQAGLNIAFLVALAFAVAASANLPTILYTLFWKRFTTHGALWSMYGGLIACVVLIIFSPVVSGGPINQATGKSTSLLQGVDFSWFPLSNPGLVSIPLSFFLGWLGTVLSKEKPNRAKWAELEVRSLTGIGAEKAVQH